MIIVTMRWEKLGEEEFEGEIKNSVGPLSISDKMQAVEPDCPGSHPIPDCLMIFDRYPSPLPQFLENNPQIPPSSRDEGFRLLHGLETNLAASLQTPQEA